MVNCCYVNAAKKASSPSEIVKQLVGLGISSSAETSVFAKEIFARVEHRTSGPNVGAAIFLTLNCLE